MSKSDKKSSVEAKGISEEVKNAKVSYEQPKVDVAPSKWMLTKEESNALFDEFKLMVSAKAAEISKIHGYPAVPQLQQMLRNEIVDSLGRMSKWRKLYIDARDELDALKGIKRVKKYEVKPATKQT